LIAIDVKENEKRHHSWALVEVVFHEAYVHANDEFSTVISQHFAFSGTGDGMFHPDKWEPNMDKPLGKFYHQLNVDPHNFESFNFVTQQVIQFIGDTDQVGWKEIHANPRDH
jgi:hypothetical protein